MVKNKIALITNSSWNLYNFRRSLIQDLIQQNFQVYCIAPVDEYTPEIQSIEGLNFIPLHRFSPYSKSPFNAFTSIAELVRILRKYHFHKVMLFTIKPNLFGGLASIMTRTRYVNVLTGLGTAFSGSRLQTLLIKLAYRTCLLKTDAVVFQNEEDKNLFIASKVISKEKVRLIPGSGLPLSEWQFEEMSKYERSFKFVFVGRLLVDKGIRELVKAIIKLKQSTKQHFEVHFIGSYLPEHPKSITKKLFEEIQDQPLIQWHGKSPMVKEYLKEAHIMILPSYREGLSKAILEAMAIGRPIITTNVGGCKELVKQGENGWLVPPGNSDLLKEKMEEAMNTPLEKLAIMGKQSRQLVEQRFSTTIVNPQYIQLFEE